MPSARAPTFGGAVNGRPLVVPLGLDVHVVVLAVRRARGGVRGAVLLLRQLAVRVGVCGGRGGGPQEGVRVRCLGGFESLKTGRE